MGKKGVHLSKIFRTSKGTPCETYEQALIIENEENKIEFKNACRRNVEAMGVRYNTSEYYNAAEHIWDFPEAFISAMIAHGLIKPEQAPDTET